MKERVLSFFLFSSCFLFFMLGCMPTIPPKLGMTSNLNERIGDMPKRVGLYCEIIPNPSINIKLNEKLKAGLIRLDFDVLGFQQMQQVLEKSLLELMIISKTQGVRLTSPEIARLTEEDKKKLIEQLGLEALFLGFGERVAPLKYDYWGFGEITRIKVELIDIKTAKIIWFADAWDRGRSEKSAYFNAAKQVLELFEKDIKAFGK